MLQIVVTMQSLKDPTDTDTIDDVSLIKNFWSTERHGSECISLKSRSRGTMNINLRDYSVTITHPKEDNA